MQTVSEVIDFYRRHHNILDRMDLLEMHLLKNGLRLSDLARLLLLIFPTLRELVRLLEFRHLGGLRDNFEIIDGKEYLTTANYRKSNLCYILFTAMSQKSLCSISLMHYAIMQSKVILIKQIERNPGLSRSHYVCCTCAEIA